MRTVLFASLCAFAAGSLAAGSPVLAQAAPAAEQQGHGWHGRPAPDFAAMRQRRADDLALLIGLRPDQRPALDALLASMEPPHRDWGKDRGDSPPPAPGSETTLAKIDHMSARIDERSAAEKTKLDTLRRFYASLSPDQKLRFDALDRLRPDHEGPHGGHGGPGGPGHGGPDHDGPGGPDGHGPDGGPPPRG